MWVQRLRREGWHQAIASSAPRANVDVMLEAVGIAAEIDAVVSAEDVRAGKPDPEVFLTAAERLGVPAERCIVVEDAAAGIEAARRAGMRSIGVSTSAVLEADVFVRSLADLGPDAFERLLSTSNAKLDSKGTLNRSAMSSFWSLKFGVITPSSLPASVLCQLCH